MNGKITGDSRFVPAPAADIFELLANPARHGEIDGSNMIQHVLESAPARLSLGSTFGMSMKKGVPYKITNTVVEFEEGRRIAWRHFGGHVWRYILEPVEGGTQVTEQFEWTNAKSPLLLELARYPKKNLVNIKRTLDNLVAKFS